MKATPQNIRIVCGDLDHPECVALSPDGTSLYAGGEAGQIYRIDSASGASECIARTGGFILGITLDRQGNVHACDVKRREIVRCLPDGQITTYACGTKDRPLVNPNYSVFDSEGRLFFSDSGDYWSPSGSIWVVEPGTPAEPLTAADLPFVNGMCLDSEEKQLYVALSTAPAIVRFQLDGKSIVGQPKIVATLPPGTVPDGIALDSSRNVWLGCYVPDEIWKISPAGAIEPVVQDRTGELLNRPTNIALGRNRIFFANLGGYHIGSFETEVEPLPLNYP